MRHAILLLVPLLLYLLAAACRGGEEAEPTPTPSPAVAQPSPTRQVTASQRIAYIGTDNDVWTINADGTGRQRLFDVPNEAGESASNLKWSPDGSKFAVTKSPKGVVYIVSAEGVKLLEVPAVAFLAWSPIGDTFAVSRPPALGIEAAMLVLDLTGQAVAEIPDGTEPSFSVDGSNLAYLVAPDPNAVGGLCGAPTQGFLADLETSTALPLDPDQEPLGCDSRPVFNPSDPSLVAHRDQLFDVKSGQQRSVPGNVVSWSPNGRLLQLCRPGQVLLYDLDEEAAVLEFPYSPAPDGPCWAHLAGWSGWSPDSAQVATYGLDGVLHIRDIATGDAKMVSVGNGSGVLSLQFSRNGQHLLLSRYPSDVWLMNADGSNLSQLTEASEPAWQPQP